jgi:dihydrofolate reductase
MAKVRAEISVSLDGYVAGPDQSPEEPLGIGGERLHEWVFDTKGWRESHGREGGDEGIDSDISAAMLRDVGAVVMGRNMFGGGPGGWDPEWKGWWGEEPPYHVPTYVLTHHPREPVAMAGGTTFHFVTDGVEAARDEAVEAAGERDVIVMGGASAINQFIAAGLVDELFLHVVPIVLGAGARLLEDVGQPHLRQLEVIASPAVTHLRYAVG